MVQIKMSASLTVSSLSSGKMSYSAQQIDKVLLLLFIEMLNIVRKRVKSMRLGIYAEKYRLGILKF